MSKSTPYKMINGLSEVIGDYDAVILDLWGVVHDGVDPYPNSIPAMTALKNAGIPVALLSNAPRRSSVVTARMEDMGIARDLYGPAVASGEIAYSRLVKRSVSVVRQMGAQGFHGRSGSRYVDV